MRPHIAYTHNKPCVTLIQHFCDDLGRFALKDNKGRQGTTHFATICDVLYHSTILYSAPFHFWTICDICRFRTFQYSAKLRRFFQHVSSDPFHMISAPQFRLFGYYFAPIGLALRRHFAFHSIIITVLMCLVTTTTKQNGEFPLRQYHSVLTSDLVAPLVVVVLAHVSRISHRSLSPFLELRCTVSTDLSLT